MSPFDLENPFDLKDKVAGGPGGIGSAIAREYGRAGASVVVASRNQNALDTVAALGVATLAVAADIANPDDVARLIAATVDRFGRVDVMVNNAGGGSSMKKAEDTPYDEWVRLIDFNLTGTFNCCMAAGKQMIEQRQGKILNISSVAGTKGNPGMLHYSAAKAGASA